MNSNKEERLHKKISLTLSRLIIIIIGTILLTSAGIALGAYFYERATEVPTYQWGPCTSTLACPDEPVIYLYPEHTEQVMVRLDYKGGLRTSYPAYNATIHGWSVTAQPDGALIDNKDGKPYDSLLWEGASYPLKVDETSGFVVKGADTAQFLQDSLSKLGLLPKEYNAFISYWLPQLQNNPYNYIHFSGKEYTDIAPLTILPTPNSMLRVFMAYQPLNSSRPVTAQKLAPFVRKGFTVVEWGGGLKDLNLFGNPKGNTGSHRRSFFRLNSFKLYRVRL